MLPDIQLLTIPISTTGCFKPVKLSTTNLLKDFGNISAQTIESFSFSDYMANSSPRSNRSREENELWFSMSASLNVSLSHSRQGTPQNLSPEQSAYRSTSNRINLGSGTSRSTSQLPNGPPSSNLNKPLPPSPSEVGRRNRNSWRGLLHRESPPSKPTHLRPEPYPERGSSLSLNTQTQSHHGHSRSMPSSPFSYEQSHLHQPPVALPRAQSSMGDYSDASQYQPYSLPCQNQSPSIAGGRSTSMNTYFDPTIPPRSRTFPETTISPIAREDVSHRPRPHTTWLSPTEPFNDISQFHLFAEAMTGLPNDSDPFSPTGPPQLQGSLFARRSRNDTIPIPLQQSVQSTSFRSTRPSVRDDWQNFEPPPSVSISQHVAPPSNSPNPQPQSQQQWQPPPHMAGINRELELLGLDEEHGSDDELPNYAQSQAEANEKRRAEASARARELEARWRGTRR